MLGNIFVWLLATVNGGIFYRLGGAAYGNRMYREIGCPLIAYVYTLYLLGMSFWWQALIACGAMAGAISTYHYFLPKPKDYSWWYYAMHGFFVSASALPLPLFTGKWLGYGLRVVVCTVGCGLADLFIWKSDEWNERTRGALIEGTLPLLLIP